MQSITLSGDRFFQAIASPVLTRRKTSQFLMSVVDSLSREYDLQSTVATIYNDPPSTL